MVFQTAPTTTPTAFIETLDGQAWNNTGTPALESWLDSHYSQYQITLTQRGASRLWYLTIPAGLPARIGPYTVTVAVPAVTATPVLGTDSWPASGTLNWDATSIFDIGSRMATYTQPTGFLTATFPSLVASTTNITAIGSVTGAVGSVTGNVGGNLSGNVNGSVVGSVASVTGSVGSVSGSVGSVTGDIGGKVLGGGSSSITGDGVRASSVTGSVASVTGAVGSVSGAVGSVTGNVGGNVSGKVLGGGSGTITGDGVRASSVTGTVGSVTGAVGSVTGDIGGNLTGNVVGRVLGGGSTAFTGIGAQVDLEEMGGIPDGVAGLSLLGVDYASGDLEGNVATQVWAWPSSIVTTAGSMGVLIKDQPTTIWSVPLPGSFASGTAGNILGNSSGGGGGASPLLQSGVEK